MENDKLRKLLSEDTIVIQEEPVETEQDTLHDQVMLAATQVIASYQNANKWLDSIKETVLMEFGLVFFSNYIHNLAHTMPVRFDKFGDILHTVNMTIPYPATEAISSTPSEVAGVFPQLLDILGSISESLRAFIKVTQDSPCHAMSCDAENLLTDISSEFTNIYRMQRAFNISGDNLKFDKWIADYMNNLGNLID